MCDATGTLPPFMWAKPMRRSAERRIPDIAAADEEDIEGFRKAMERDCVEIARRLGRTTTRMGGHHVSNIALHSEQATKMGITQPTMEERMWSDGQREEMQHAAGRALRSLHESIIRNAKKELPQKIVGRTKIINKQITTAEKVKKHLGSIRQQLHNDDPWSRIHSNWQNRWNDIINYCNDQELHYPDPTQFPQTDTDTEPNYDIPLPPINSSSMRTLWYRQLGVLYQITEQQIHAADNINRIKRIEEATEARNANFKDNMKACLDSILERRGTKIVIDRAQTKGASGTTIITYEEEEVKAAMRDTYTEWLGPQGFKAPEQGSRLAMEYKPKTHIMEEWYEGVDRDSTVQEIKEALAEMGKNKATGPSGVSRELIIMAGDKAVEILREVINLCIWMKDVPDEMGRVVIVAIPKTAEWGGNPWKTRPISLMEVTHKLLEHILTRRLQVIEQQHPEILQGYNFGCRNGYSTDDALHVLNNIIDYSKITKRPLFTLITDLSI